MNIKIEYNDKVSIKTEDDPFYDNNEETETEVMCEDFEDNYCSVLKVEIKQESSPTTLEIELEMTADENNDTSTIKTENSVENPQLVAPSLQMKVPLSSTSGGLPGNSVVSVTPALQRTSGRPNLVKLNTLSSTNLRSLLQNPPPLLYWNAKPSEKNTASMQT